MIRRGSPAKHPRGAGVEERYDTRGVPSEFDTTPWLRLWGIRLAQCRQYRPPRRPTRQPSSIRPAAIRATLSGSGTACITPNSPCDSSLGPAVK
jgi:hypothetical protein